MYEFDCLRLISRSYSIFTERLGCEKNSYELTELCSELKPCNSCQNGRYERIVSNPPVYFYTYETTQQACKAKRSDFTMNILDVGNDEIFEACHQPTYGQDLREFVESI